MRIAIIGLGLIGGSLGMALRKSGAGVEVVGFARRPEVAATAVDRGAVDRTAPSAAGAVKDADVVIIATPAMAVGEIFGQISGSLRRGAIVTDTASTKAAIMDWARGGLPPWVSFIGGHPMAGRETSGIEAADGQLFAGCTYCLVPAEGSTGEPLAQMEELVRGIGARPHIMQAAEHDRMAAGISHLPLLISVALVATTAESPMWSQMARLAASGYRDLTRLASGDPRMARDICITNREPIVSWLDEYIEALRALRRLVMFGSEQGEELERSLERARSWRQRWLDKRE